MAQSARWEKFESKLDSISRSVCIIEKEHGAKLDALFDAYQVTNDHLDRLDGDVSVLKDDVRDIKRGLGVLQSIASDSDGDSGKVS
jgi:CRISPR/Cas system type I-B associated protein Csh2 (Cas7 group RAMP superfamily)